MGFGNYGLPKRWLDQCLKSPVSEDPSKRNMVNAPKHCLNLKNSTFANFVDNWDVNCRTKGLY